MGNKTNIFPFLMISDVVENFDLFSDSVRSMISTRYWSMWRVVLHLDGSMIYIPAIRIQ